MSPTATRGRILVVDDDEATRPLVCALLASRGYATEEAATGAAALTALEHGDFDLALLDINLPDCTGLDILVRAPAQPHPTEFVMITAFASVETAIEAMKRGAYDYLRKPLRTDELLRVVERAIADVHARPAIAERKRRDTDGMRARMIAGSAQMEEVWDRIEKVAPTRATVLITGETGVGKELVARAIHELSPRCQQPFIATNCSSLSETLLESELFGHQKGSFTGALTTRRGLFEEASRGTLFLDELSTMSPGMQVKLLRVIQERTIQRIGSHAPIPVDIRMLGATNVDLMLKVAQGHFREDLFYRLNVFPIRVPPLRERRQDVPLLANHFVQRVAQQLGVEPPALPPSTLHAMAAYDWPGNVRQLENFIETAVITCNGGPITFEAPPPVPTALEAASPAPRQDSPDNSAHALSRVERQHVEQALLDAAGHRARAAALLGIDRRTLYRKLKQYEEEDAALRGKRSEAESCAPSVLPMSPRTGVGIDDVVHAGPHGHGA